MAGEPQVFACPACGSGVKIRAAGMSVSVACRSCGSIIDAANANYTIIDKAAQRLKIEPLIALGQRGQLKGVLWEVIGFMKRCDETEVYTWHEYLLFNPLKGFRWLTEFDGHWNYVVQIKEKPNRGRVLGKTYQLFHKGAAKVLYVVGEFYWRVKIGERVTVEDYIAPPEILSCERSADETVWSIGEYIEADTVRAAFDIKKPMPYAHGVAPNQPKRVHASEILKYWGFFVVFLCACQFFFWLSAKNDVVSTNNFTYRVDDPEKQKVTPQFELKYGLSNVDFTLISPVENNWVEVNIELVNDQTEDSYEFEQGVEYYSGYDGDESWTEGSHVSDETLSSIPAGLYHLNIQASGPAGLEVPYRIVVTRNVPILSNFFWSLVLLSIYPAFVWWRSRSFERARWSTSDFSPYWSQHKE